MSLNKKRHLSRERRVMRVRQAETRGQMPRVSVYRSLGHIYAQIIDDNAQHTLASVSSLKIKSAGDKSAIAHLVGKELAQKAQKLGVTKVSFDRGRFLYHGRVKALADGLREGGLQI